MRIRREQVRVVVVTFIFTGVYPEIALALSDICKSSLLFLPCPLLSLQVVTWMEFIHQSSIQAEEWESLNFVCK